MVSNHAQKNIYKTSIKGKTSMISFSPTIYANSINSRYFNGVVKYSVLIWKFCKAALNQSINISEMTSCHKHSLLTNWDYSLYNKV